MTIARSGLKLLECAAICMSTWMKMSAMLFPVILAGGSGTRLWPLSRKNFPKQFLCLQGKQSLLQQTMQRVALLNSSHCLIVSNDAHYFLCQEQLQAWHKPAITYILEPCARNTAPAIAAAAHYLVKAKGPDAVMLILPSDHWIGNNQAFKEAMQKGYDFAAREKAIITFGIKPDHPKTGYGYIEAGQTLEPGVHQIRRFTEKPDAPTAQGFLDQGHYFWNSGMFAVRAGVYLEELKKQAPDIQTQSRQALDEAYHHHDFIRLEESAFAQCRSESIDYAVMEKTQASVVIPIDIAWSDLGCWTSVAEANDLDKQGNVLQGNVLAQESQNCFISSTHALVTTLGIQNQIVVATADAILVADKAYSQQVKDLVQTLSQNNPSLLDDHPRVSRPWGYYEVLAEGAAFKVKRLMVKPGARLSLQRHQRRAEHWVVVGGEAEVINDDKVLRLTVNQSTYIPQRTRHRLSNPGNEPLFVIEVQSGDYLGEDDIERFDDVYQRRVTVPA